MCGVLPSRNTNDFCSVEKRIPKLIVVLPCETFAGFVSNLAIFFQCSFSSTHVTPLCSPVHSLVKGVKASSAMCTSHVCVGHALSFLKMML